MQHLHIDIETYSSVDIKKAGLYKYVESSDFEILMVAYKLDDDPVQIIDMKLDQTAEHHYFWKMLKYRDVIKHAHNAAFERLAFARIGFNTDPSEWRCSMTHAAYCGWPLALDKVSKAMDLQEFGKSSTGKSLIRYFSSPVKPTKVNGGRTTRNLPHHNPEKWEQFKKYCKQDVVAEVAVSNRLEAHPVPEQVWQEYALDQKINDRGIEVDQILAENIINIDKADNERITEELKQITGLQNPNSVAQLKDWLSAELGQRIESLAKDKLEDLIEQVEGGVVRRVLELRQQAGKTSVKKYVKMLETVCKDGRIKGLFQFYGANRTGRWAGRHVQMQNLPRNYVEPLDFTRELFRSGSYEDVKLFFGSEVKSIMSELIRTAFVASPGNTFAVADFSAIEARVLAWMAGEQWRLRVFETHGKIYEASAASMFGVDIETITKESPLRAKGKVAELALGYQGAVGAMIAMGADKMGLSENEMKALVKRWRRANPNIVRFWKKMEQAALRAVRIRNTPVNVQGVIFEADSEYLRIKLLSGRELFYVDPKMAENRFGMTSISYMGVNDKNQWARVESYGGKLTENIVQAISRDLLTYAISNADAKGFDIVGHVHDEIIVDTDDRKSLNVLESAMCDLPKWAKGLPIDADGFNSDFYKK